MKAVISSTYDDKYLWFIPIVTFLWDKLGVDVICFMPYSKTVNADKLDLVMGAALNNGKIRVEFFSSPEHKEATYAQCSRLYAACLDLPEDEILITSDIDMIVFKVPPYENDITIFGHDLVPQGQYPMCYATGSVKDWRSAMKLKEREYQKHLDELLGHIEANHFRGNYWGKDQETLWENTCDISTLIPRAKPGTQFASHRYDRDDAFLLDRLSLDTIDYHLPRPGYGENNFNQILTVLKFHYPNENFDWLINYRNEYLKLI